MQTFETDPLVRFDHLRRRLVLHLKLLSLDLQELFGVGRSNSFSRGKSLEHAIRLQHIIERFQTILGEILCLQNFAIPFLHQCNVLVTHFRMFLPLSSAEHGLNALLLAK